MANGPTAVTRESSLRGAVRQEGAQHDGIAGLEEEFFEVVLVEEDPEKREPGA